MHKQLKLQNEAQNDIDCMLIQLYLTVLIHSFANGYHIFRGSYRLVTLKCSQNDQTPYTTTLREVSESISSDDRFFFPGHRGNEDKYNTLDMRLDLPELDLIDSVHSPDVSIC